MTNNLWLIHKFHSFSILRLLNQFILVIFTHIFKISNQCIKPFNFKHGLSFFYGIFTVEFVVTHIALTLLLLNRLPPWSFWLAPEFTTNQIILRVQSEHLQWLFSFLLGPSSFLVVLRCLSRSGRTWYPRARVVTISF